VLRVCAEDVDELEVRLLVIDEVNVVEITLLGDTILLETEVEDVKG
jgi:hypothetical protein